MHSTQLMARGSIVLAAIICGALRTPAQAGETVTYLHNDAAGSPLAATDTNGLVTWKETYRPYGDRLVNSSASRGNQLWFSGKPFDAASGLSYVGARYYDPTLGRFMGVDPMPATETDLHSFNRYAYANNNPLRHIDPTGMWSINFNGGLLAFNIGRDESTAQFFWQLKAGMNGLGVSIDPGNDAPSGDGRYGRECLECPVASSSWQTGNAKAGVVIGPLSWQPIEYDFDTVITDDVAGGEDHAYLEEGEGWITNWLGLESAFDGKKFGLEITLEANMEFGATISWDDFRRAFGLPPLETKRLEHLPDGSSHTENR